MRNLDGDQRDVRVPVLGRHNRGDLLVGLEFDDEVDVLAHEHIGVALGDLRIVAVVHANQLDTLGGGRALQAGRHFL